MSTQSKPLVVVEFGDEMPPRSFDGVLPDVIRHGRMRVDPLMHAEALAASLDLDALAKMWAARLDAAGDPPTAVLGYCTGSGLAAALADRFNENTMLVLFDPVLPTPHDAQSLLAELAVGMDEGLPPSAVPRITDLSTADALKVGGEFLRTVAVRSAPDLPEDLVDALTEKQRGWLSYTLAASSVGRWPRMPDYVFLSSAGNWPASEKTVTRRFDTDPVDLFHSQDVRRALTPLLQNS